MPVKLDRSDRTVVVYCTDCPGWADLALGDARGHDLAVDHERRVHPGAEQAKHARETWQARHAGR